MTLLDLTARASRDLQAAGISAETAALDAELLARHALGWDRATWVLRRREEAAADFVDIYQELLARRRAREPLAYIRGVHEFWGREFIVSPSALIPRSETELLIEEVLRVLPQDYAGRIVDVGAGSGCVAITLALERPRARVQGTDISAAALQLARRNAEQLGASVTFTHGEYFANLAGPFDVVVSNPPYVAGRDRPALSPEVMREPEEALFGGTDGLQTIAELLTRSVAALAPSGQLFMEMGFGQDDAVAALAGQVEGLRLERIASDLRGIPRLLVATKVTAPE